MLTHSTYGNRSTFGMKSASIRHTWILYYLLVLLFSFIGDMIILIASIKYKAFKLHNFIIAVMQHIAVCDMAVCTFWVFPRVISLIADQWILGEQFCQIQPYMMYYFGTACLLLTCAMAVSKLSILTFPLRSRYLTPEKSHQVCAVVWAISWNVPITFLDGVDVCFDLRTYSCDFIAPNTTSSLLISTVLNLVIPNVLVVTSTSLIVIHLLKARRAARRSNGQERWQGIFTTICTAVLYTVSVVPLTIYCFAMSFAVTSEPGLNRISFFHYHFYRFATAIILLNILANFFIHSLTVLSFRKFLLSGIKQIESLVFGTSEENLTNV